MSFGAKSFAMMTYTRASTSRGAGDGYEDKNFSGSGTELLGGSGYIRKVPCSENTKKNLF